MSTKLETITWSKTSDTKKLIKAIKKYGLGKNPSNAEKMLKSIHCQTSAAIVAALEASEDFVIFPIEGDLDRCLFEEEHLGGPLVGKIGNIYVQRSLNFIKDEIVINKKKKIVVEFTRK